MHSVSLAAALVLAVVSGTPSRETCRARCLARRRPQAHAIFAQQRDYFSR